MNKNDEETFLSGYAFPYIFGFCIVTRCQSGK